MTAIDCFCDDTYTIDQSEKIQDDKIRRDTRDADTRFHRHKVE